MYRSTFFLTSALVGGKWSASRPGRFTPGERTPSTNWIGGQVGPRASLDDVEKILDPYWDSNSDPSVVQPVASRYTDCAIPAPFRFAVRDKNHISKYMSHIYFSLTLFSCYSVNFVAVTNSLDFRSFWREQHV
jgi:hypothetical protein